MSDNKLIYYLKCTSFSEDNPQGYDDMPIFHKHVWPLIENNINSIETIYLFQPYEEKPSICEKEFMNSLHPMQLEHIAHRSYYGGHLDVYYKTNSISFISRLIGLWQRPCVLQNSARDLQIEDYKVLFIENIVNEMDRTFILFGFGHDGDPLYLFGHKLHLGSLIEEIEKG